MDYVLRLQALDGYAAKFQTVFGERFSRVLCVHHTGRKGDNPHYHFCLTTDYKRDALRKYLKLHFDLAKGNRHLSLKDWDGDPKACSYLFHEGTQELISKGFTTDELDSFKEKNTAIQAKMVKPIMVVDKAVEILMAKSHKHPTHREIFNIVFDVYVDSGEWLPNRFQWERIVNKVRLEIAKLTDPHAVGTMKMQMYREMFPYDWAI